MRSFDLPKDGSDLRLNIAAGPAWLEVEEAGQRVQIAGASSEVLTLPQPFRYGWHWVLARSGDRVTIRRVQAQSRARGSVRAALYCSSTPELQRKLGWLHRAGEIGALLDRPVERERVTQTLGAIDALRNDAPTAIEHAIALHYAAQVLAANSLGSEALAAFDQAEQAWAALHERERALAAHLGRIEQLRSIDALQQVIAQTPDVASLHGPPSYFATRLENPRCLALQSLGRFDAAATCFDWLQRRYRALGEDEDFIAAAQGYAGLLRDRGDLQAADESAQRSLALVSGPDAPMLRGRLRLTLADIALRRGQLANSFSFAELALRDFDADQYDAASWRASGLMFTAILYSQLGANDEAYGALADAVRIIAPLNMPSRMATAMNVFADIETNLRRTQSAWWWRRAAEETFARLNMASAYQATRAIRLDLQAQLGDLADIKRELPAMSAADPLHAAQMSLLTADVALREGRLDAARAALDTASRAPLSLRNQIRAAVLDADYRDRSGGAGAQDALRASADRVDALARRAGNPALRYVIARQLSTLRGAAYRLALAQLPASADPGVIAPLWEWLAYSASEPSAAPTASSTRASAEAFDRAVATELLSQPGRPAPPSDASAQRELLSLLAQAGHVDSAPIDVSVPALATLQQQLEPDAALIAYINGDTRGALLWITHDAARLVAAAAPDQVRTSAIALRELVRSAGAAVAAIRSAAQRLSAQVLGGLPPMQPPRHLYVVAEEPFNGVAWSVLPWPGGSEPLLESTAVSLVHLARENGSGAHSQTRVPEDLHVVVAAQSHTPGSVLRNLAAAGVEAAQIRKAFGDGLPRVDENTHASPDSLLALLAVPAAWVHVAAHGTAQPQRIGYAGIWLEPTAEDATPAFLSWLDVLDRGARADLVVLDACQLGDSGSAVSGNLSFADAVSRAGARRVVAALWPVSDAASALWVPAFYQALVADPGHDSAQALRSAQQRLRASRAFTHPFFWAGLQSIERLEFAAQPRTAR